MNALSRPFKGRDGAGMGCGRWLIDEIAARKTHPPPNLPLQGGGVDAYGIHTITPDSHREAMASKNRLEQSGGTHAGSDTHGDHAITLLRAL